MCCEDGKLWLKADNGKYLCRKTMVFEDDDEGGDGSGGVYTAQAIVPEGSTRQASCEFLVNNRADGIILLQANNSNYLCREKHDPYFQPIEARYSTPRKSCHFKVHNQPNDKVVLQADNGKFLSRVYRVNDDFSVNLIEAYKDNIDVSCKFSFEQE